MVNDPIGDLIETLKYKSDSIEDRVIGIRGCLWTTGSTLEGLIADLQKLHVRVSMGDKFSDLEKLGLRLLLANFGIEPK